MSKFDRHAILKAHYAERIRRWDWSAIKSECESNAEYDREADAKIGRCYLGSVLNVFPSGKYYTFWTTSQTRADETRDAAFSDALDEIASEHGGSVGGSDGDGCDLIFSMVIDE